MFRTTCQLAQIAAVACLLWMGAGRAAAQGVVVTNYGAPAVSYYSAPAVSYYSPPAVSYYVEPRVSYYSAPAVSYYTAPSVSYYSAPAVSYYAAPAAVTTTRYGLFGRRVVTTSYSPVYVYP